MILFNNGRKININKIIKRVLLFFIFILLTVSFFGMRWFLNNSKEFFYQAAKAGFYDSFQSDILNQLDAKVINRPAEDLNIAADSIMSVEIKDGQEKILFSKNDQEKLPMASLTKLMTALVVLEKYDLKKKVVISSSAMAELGEQGNLKSGEILSVKNLLYITLIESSNKAAKALSEVVGTDKFIALMNFTSQKMGLVNTHFEDSTGLNPASYSTSQDLAKLSKYLFENYPLFRKIISLKEFDLYLDGGQFHHKLINTNKLLGEVPGVIGGKTGWTNEARGCFIAIQKNADSGMYFIHIILGADDRFKEMKKLINITNAI